MGITCVAESPEDADALYQELTAALVGPQPSIP